MFLIKPHFFPSRGRKIGAPSHGGLLAGYLLSRRPFGGPKWDATASKADSVAVKPNSREMWAPPAADHVLYSFRRKTVQISAYLTCKRSRRCLTTCTMLWIRFAVNIECMRCSSKLAKWEKYIYTNKVFVLRKRTLNKTSTEFILVVKLIKISI